MWVGGNSKPFGKHGGHTQTSLSKITPLVCLLGQAQDMVAFSCCVFDGGKQERLDMDAARERGWRGKFTKPGRVIRPGAIRINGKCPLTPLEVTSCDLYVLPLIYFGCLHIFLEPCI